MEKDRNNMEQLANEVKAKIKSVLRAFPPVRIRAENATGRVRSFDELVSVAAAKLLDQMRITQLTADDLGSGVEIVVSKSYDIATDTFTYQFCLVSKKQIDLLKEE